MTSPTPGNRPAIGRLTTEFEDADREDRFRRAVLPEWRHRAVLAAVVGAVAFALFGIVDCMDSGWSGHFYTVLAAALGPLPFVAAAAWSWPAWIGLPANSIGPSLRSSCVSSRIFCTIVVLVPQRTNVHIIGMIAMILFFYLFVPTRAVLAVAVAGGLASVAFVSTAALGTPLRGAELIGFSIIFGHHQSGRHGTRHSTCTGYGGRALPQRETERETTGSRLKKRSSGAQLAKARDEANHANRAKSEFLAHMSHELRTPLNAINGFSEIIKDEMFGPVAPRYRDYAADIFRSGMHLTALINDVLDLSKIEAGKLEMDEEIVEPSAIVESCLRLVRDRAHKASLRLVTDLPPDLPLLRADERLLKQMLLNLLTNAIKFTPEGGRVDRRRAPRRGRRARLRDPGHRHRHCRRGPAEGAGALWPGGHGARPQPGRHRPRPAAGQEDGRAARRHAHARQLPRRRHDRERGLSARAAGREPQAQDRRQFPRPGQLIGVVAGPAPPGGPWGWVNY